MAHRDHSQSVAEEQPTAVGSWRDTAFFAADSSLAGVVEGALPRTEPAVSIPVVNHTKRQLLAKPLLLGIDAFAFSLSIAAAYLVRDFLALFIALPALSPALVLDALWWIPLLGCTFFIFESSYNKRLTFWQEAGEIVKTATLVFLVATAALFVTKLGGTTSRSLMVLAWAFSLFTLPALRYAGKLALIRLHIWERPVLILGAGKTGQLVLNALHRETTMGWKPVGFLDDDPAKQQNPPRLPSGDAVPVLGRFKDAEAVMQRTGIRDVIIAAPGLPGSKLVNLVNRLQRKTSNLIVIPDLFGMSMEGIAVQSFADERTLALKITNNLNSRLNLAIKRIFDLTLVVCASPVFVLGMLIVGLAVKLDSKGPVLFVDKRIGKNGREFECYKFRSMYPDSDRLLNDFLAAHPHLREQWDAYAKLKDYDPRVTRVGRVIRRLSLDELPQIINVLKGDMSLVGPRPYLPRERQRMKGREDILVTWPGITGLWQVSGRNGVDFDGRLQIDSWYVRNWSLWLDIVLLLRTLAVVIRGKGAY